MSLDVEDFFKEYEKHIAYKNAQKLRGNNDLNIFTSILDQSDEVRLHSRFLYSLLNPSGKHYQGTLFLDLFLTSIGLQSFGLDIEKTNIFKEYKNIDLYITDGNKHVIIENKIYAHDIELQLQKYIDNIVKEKNIMPKNVRGSIYVIYLSLDRDEPSEKSLGKFGLKGNFLECGDIKIPFKSIKYKNEIKQWLHVSLKEVKNLINLNVFISQYIDVLDKLYGTYKSNVIDFEYFINKDYLRWNIYEQIVKDTGHADFESKAELVDDLKKEYNEIAHNLLKKITKKISKHILKSLGEDSSLINKIEYLIKPDGKMYIGYRYIRVSLNNGIVIRLDHDMNLSLEKSICVQYHNTTNLKNKEEQYYPVENVPPKAREINIALLAYGDDEEWLKKYYPEAWLECLKALINEKTREQ